MPTPAPNASLQDLDRNSFTTDPSGDYARRVVVSNSITATTSELKPNLLTTGTASSLAAAATADIISYTVPVTKTFAIFDINATGDGDGIYFITINGSTIDTQRTAWTNRNANFKFHKYTLVAGDIIKLRVTNNNLISRNYTGVLIGNLT